MLNCIHGINIDPSNVGASGSSSCWQCQSAIRNSVLCAEDILMIVVSGVIIVGKVAAPFDTSNVTTAQQREVFSQLARIVGASIDCAREVGDSEDSDGYECPECGAYDGDHEDGCSNAE